MAEPFLVGALTAAVLCFGAVGLTWVGRDRLAIGLAVATVVVLLAEKLLWVA